MFVLICSHALCRSLHIGNAWFFLFFTITFCVETVFPPPISRGNEPHPPFLKTLFYELISKNCSLPGLARKREPLTLKGIQFEVRDRKVSGLIAISTSSRRVHG